MLDFKDFEPNDKVFEPKAKPDTLEVMEVSAPQKDEVDLMAKAEGETALDVGADFFEKDIGLSEEDRQTLMKQMVKVAEKYGEEKRSISVAENKIKGRKGKLQEVEEKLFAMLEACGMQSFGAGAFTYFTRVDSYPSIAVEKAAFRWIEREGFRHIIKLNVNLKTLGSTIKEIFETTGEKPGENDGIDIRTVNRVGVRKR